MASRLAVLVTPKRLLAPDRAWMAIAAIFVALLVLAPSQAERSFLFTLDAFAGVLPFLLLSVALAAYAAASSADSLVARAFTGRTSAMIVFAAGMGALSPFCSCGVIPLIAALLALGVPLAPVMAFWLSSPLMDPSMFVLTAGMLGTQFAIAKTLAAFGIGLLGGFGVLVLQRSAIFTEPLRPDVGNGGCAGSRIRAPKEIAWQFWRDPQRRLSFATSARRNLLFLGKWLVLAFVLESLMLAYVPGDMVARAVGEGGLLQVVSATLVGIPAYLNGYAALPLVAGLIQQGMAPGAGMAFLLAGGVSSIPAAIAVFALARLPVFLAYLGLAFLGALSAGLIYGWLL